MRQVLNSSALVALIHKQAGHDYVYRLIERTQEGEADLYLSELNYGEILHVVARTWGIEEREYHRRVLPTLPVTLVPVDRALIEQGAEIKALRGGAFLDAICAALAERLDATVVTGDQEFHNYGGLVEIEWLG